MQHLRHRIVEDGLEDEEELQGEWRRSEQGLPMNYIAPLRQNVPRVYSFRHRRPPSRRLPARGADLPRDLRRVGRLEEELEGIGWFARRGARH